MIALKPVTKVFVGFSYISKRSKTGKPSLQGSNFFTFVFFSQIKTSYQMVLERIVSLLKIIGLINVLLCKGRCFAKLSCWNDSSMLTHAKNCKGTLTIGVAINCLVKP